MKATVGATFSVKAVSVFMPFNKLSVIHKNLALIMLS
jgi:hypothetical protein